jgi:hypothetical protein
METYIAKTWMQKKEKLLLYNRLTTWNFDQCTLCPAEHENSSMKWGEIVVTPQQYMHQTVHTINKKSNSRFTVKEGHGAKNLDATQNWSITNINEFVSQYAEGMISFQWSRHSLYMSIRISSRIWWMMLIIRDDGKPAAKGLGSDDYEWLNGFKDIMFLSVTVVTFIKLACRAGIISREG